MPVFVKEKMEGGPLGLVVYNKVLNILNDFFSLPIQNIQDECNNVLKKYERIWDAKIPTNQMDEYGLKLSYLQGISELYPPFRLSHPSTVRIQIIDSNYQTTHAAAATIFTSHDTMNPILAVFLKAISITGHEIIWTGMSTTFTEAINHEIFHLCGDAPIFNNRIQDSYLRQTLIGNEALDNLSSPNN